jgi:2-polyprenyl-3-methyl-5-hydroxy-6-metoxy-1,4-benzoquinol methylase
VRAFWEFESQYPRRFFAYHFGARIVSYFWSHLHGKSCVLDFGCGSGHLIEAIMARGLRSGGIDASSELVLKVNARFADHPAFLGAWTTVGDASPSQWPAIVCSEVLEHLADAELEVVVATLHAALEPRGVLLVSTPNQERLTDSLVACPACRHSFHRWQHVRSWSVPELTRFLESRGFVTLDARALSLEDVNKDPVAYNGVPPHLVGAFSRGPSPAHSE